MLHPIYRYFKKIGNNEHVSAWKSKGLSDENIKSPATSDKNLAPSLVFVGVRARVKFSGHCLKQDKANFTHGKVVNIYIA